LAFDEVSTLTFLLLAFSSSADLYLSVPSTHEYVGITFFPFDDFSSAGTEVGASLVDRLDEGVASLVLDLGGILVSMYLYMNR